MQTVAAATTSPECRFQTVMLTLFPPVPLVSEIWMETEISSVASVLLVVEADEPDSELAP